MNCIKNIIIASRKWKYTSKSDRIYDTHLPYNNNNKQFL